MLTLPTITFGLVVALLIGTGYHALRGGGGGRLIFFLILSVIGFALGHYLGVWQGWNFFTIGALNLGIAIPGSIVFLVGGEWLSRIEVKNESSV